MAVFDFIKDAPARGQTEDKRLAQIPIHRIQPNPNQPRTVFSPAIPLTRKASRNWPNPSGRWA